MPRTSLNIREKLGPERPAVGWPWRLFLFSLLVLITVSVVYLGLEFGYKLYLTSQSRNQDEAISELAQIISREEQEQFVAFYSQLANVRKLLEDHAITSAILPLLEANTNKQVYYDFVDFTLKDRQLSLEGVAASYGVFTQQLEAFNRAQAVERLSVQESHTEGNRVRFRLFLILKEELFKQQ